MTELIRSTVLAGWLGSGKTTLLNELLASVKNERIAVIVNDVGDVNIDAALIARNDGDKIELTDGCICCSIGSSLALTLRDLVLVDDPPDPIIIEASGIAEPANVAAYGDRRLIERPIIIVTVDATDVLERSNDPRYGALVRRQVEQADAIVVTKDDVTGRDRPAEVDAWLAQLVPGTEVITRDGALAGYTSSRGRPERVGSRAKQPPVKTCTVDYGTGVVDLTSLEAELATDPKLLRAKGILRTASGTYVLVNLAGGRFTSADHDEPVDPTVVNRLVLITRS